MSPVRICFVCDAPILRGEPRLYVDNLSIHEYCNVDGDASSVCDQAGCMYRWTVHGGAHIT